MLLEGPGIAHAELRPDSVLMSPATAWSAFFEPGSNPFVRIRARVVAKYLFVTSGIESSLERNKSVAEEQFAPVTTFSSIVRHRSSFRLCGRSRYALARSQSK